MGLRRLVHYFDRSEAFVARSVIEAEGMLAFLHNEDWIRFYPHYVGPLGGYRLMVSEFDLEEAGLVLREARLNPLLEGDRLELKGDLLDRVMSLVVGFAIGGVPTTIRQSRWVPIEPT
jgi:hypothetical protein